LPIRILIVDDNAVIRRALRVLVEGHADWQVCGEGENGFEAVAKAGELNPDLIIMDLAMPMMDGISAAREISKTSPALPILLHTLYGSDAVNREAKKAGVRTVVSKGESGANLRGAIEVLLNTGGPKDVLNPGGGLADSHGTKKTHD
jgi:DNA-binding NarL/FixJ family response regulator